MPENRIKIKTSLKEHRQRAGLTQEELAERVGVRRETIVFLEGGAYNPSLRLALLIAREMGVSVETLFSLS